MTSDRSTMEVECIECTFSKVVGPDSDKLPAEVMIEHGQETGHQLTVSTIEDE